MLGAKRFILATVSIVSNGAAVIIFFRPIRLSPLKFGEIFRVCVEEVGEKRLISWFFILSTMLLFCEQEKKANPLREREKRF